jgi:hypothetical protein
MSAIPKEYIELVQIGQDDNFSQYTVGGDTTGTNVRTNYQKVRLDPLTLIVDISDQTFSTSTGKLTDGAGRTALSLPYAVAMCCVWVDNDCGFANIDLTGTPLAVNDTFFPRGYLAKGSANYSADNQVVDITGGGYCGWNAPDEDISYPINDAGDFLLELMYIGPLQIQIDIKPGSYPNCFNNNGHGVIPIAILSTEGFDATQVDPMTVDLDGQKVRVVGKKGNIQAHIDDVNGDGLNDLMVQIEDTDGIYEEGDTIAVLSCATFSGKEFWGADSLCIVP